MTQQENQQKKDGAVRDLIILGTGPAGLTAAVYGARYMLDTVVIGSSAGGQIAEAHKVCNFPTYENISGMELTKKMVEQVKALDVPVLVENVEDITKEGDLYKVKTNKTTHIGKKVIYSLGSAKKELGAPGEKDYVGRGVSYCATCDGAFFRDKTVAVVGGSDAALTASLLLADYAEKVYIIYRKDHFFRGEPVWVKEVEENPKIESLFNTQIKQIIGKNMVEGVILQDDTKLDVDGIFIEIGSNPNTGMPGKLGVDLEKNFIKIDCLQRTNVNGFFAAGDVTNIPLKQAITAASQGAIAANTAYEEIKRGV